MVEIHPPPPTNLPPPPPPPPPSPAMHSVNQSTRCGSCKVMETYMFWNEQPSAANKYHFTAYFSNSQPQVPQKFIYCFSGEPFGGWWSLRGPSGNEWRVKIERTEDDKAVFKEGWDVFMRDHDIDPNTLGTACFFVFSYAANSTLDVLVMDHSAGCVLESAYYATNSAGLPKKCSSSLHGQPDNINNNNNNNDNGNNINGGFGMYYDDAGFGMYDFYLPPQLRLPSPLLSIYNAYPPQQTINPYKCEGCKISEKYMFWKEQPLATNKYHFAAYFSNMLHPKIPQKFIQCFKGEKLEGWWNLKGPSGNEWRVKIQRTEDNNAVVFKEGWDVFMRDHGIKSNHSGARGYSSLVCSYAGNSTFKVIVLDGIGCVRESAYFATNSAGLLGKCSSSLHDQPNGNNN